MIGNLFKLTTAFAAGVAVDRMRPGQENPPEGGPASTGFRTGHQVLGDLTRKVQTNGPDTAVVSDALHAQVERRRRFASDALKVVLSPRQALAQAEQAAQQADAQMKLAGGLARQAGAGRLGARDGVGLVVASTQGSGGPLVAAARGAFAAATTSQADVEALQEAAKRRLAREAVTLTLGTAASTGLASVLAVVPHPAAKATALALAVSGHAALGHDASRLVQRIDASLPAGVKDELARLAKE